MNSLKRLSLLLLVCVTVFMFNTGCDDTEDLADIINTPTPISTFDDLTLSADSYWNGSDSSGGFSSGNAYFVNAYDSSYDSWDGWAYSNMTDTTTAGFTNQYSAYTGSGHVSDTYGICCYASWGNNTQIYFGDGDSNESAVPLSFYLTNTTYAYLSMQDGDDFAKKFGDDPDTTGTTETDEPDWFLLTIHGLDENYDQTGDTVEFYLADYRFDDSADDYIVDAWTIVDLSGLGEVYGLEFVLTSSDVGTYGMNTPAYFAMDNLTLLDSE